MLSCRSDVFEPSDSPEFFADAAEADLTSLSAGDRALSKLEWSQLEIAADVLPWAKVEAFQSVPLH